MKFLVESAQNTYHAYHGTRSEFKRFEQHFIGAHALENGFGFYFTDDEEIGFGGIYKLVEIEKKFEVNQIAVFNYMVGDIDEQQSSVKGIIEKARPKTAQDIAFLQDKRVRDVIIAEANCKAFTDAIIEFALVVS